MDEDATWYGSRPRRRPHFRRVPSAPRKGHSTPPPLLGPRLLWPRSPISVTAALLFLKRKTSYIHGPSLAERVEHDADALTLVDGDGPRTAGRAGGDGARSRRRDVARLIRQSSTRFVRRARFARHYQPQSGGRSSPRCVRTRIHYDKLLFTTNGSNNRVSRTKKTYGEKAHR